VRTDGGACTYSGIRVGQEALVSGPTNNEDLPNRGVANDYEFQHIVPGMPCYHVLRLHWTLPEALTTVVEWRGEGAKHARVDIFYRICVAAVYR
jgi:hypothetical protein